MSADATERLFFAVPLTEHVRDALQRHLRRWAPEGLPGREVRPESWHLTLRFLGDVAPLAGRAALREAEGAVLGPPFALGLGGWGAFPRQSRASVLWLGIQEGAEPLARLAARVETAVVAAGFAPEPRSFRPHLTLSRVRPPRDATAALERLAPFTERMPVTEVVLFRSHLGRGPAHYEAAARIPLA